MYQKYTLANGIRIISESIPYAHSAVIGIWIRTGSRNENQKNQGVSHFIEHLLFKGTTKRSAKQIAEELEALGGSLNAFTAKEYTCLYAKVLAEHLDLAIDLLADMFFNSKFAPEDISKERNVILEEIKMYDDAPDELIHDLFAATVWKDHPLGYPILGTAHSMEQIDRRIILDYFEKHYISEKTVIAVAGKVDNDKLVAMLEPTFGNWKTSSPLSNSEASPVPHAGIVLNQKNTEQVHICLGAPGFAQEDPGIFAMIILNNILGGGLSSRLFQEIREERGLVYSIYSYHSSYFDTGLFTTYVGTRPDNVSQVVQLIIKEFIQIKKAGIKNEELIRIKEQIKGNILLSMESMSNRMSRLGRTETCFGRVITGEEVVAGVSSIELNDVFKLANHLFQEEKFSLVSIGPVNEDIDFNGLIKGLSI